MIKLAIRVDRIIHRTLVSLPPGDLTFDYFRSPGLITYTLRIRQIKVGTIEVEYDSTPSFGARIIFSVIQNKFTVLQEGEEFTVEIVNLNEIIMETIQAETGKGRWREITSEPELDDQTGMPPARGSALFYQKIYADLAYFHYLKRHPWENIPNHLWDRDAVKLWCLGFSSQEIASWVQVHPRTVTNRLSELRRCYPKAGIPTHKQRMKLLLRG
jgi:hypothetical protein